VGETDFSVFLILFTEKLVANAPILASITPDFYYATQELFQKRISARLNNILQPELAPKSPLAKPSRAGRPPAQAKSELSRAFS